MTALDRAIIKKLSAKTQVSGKGPSRPRETAKPLVAGSSPTPSPAVPLSQALAGLSLTAHDATDASDPDDDASDASSTLPVGPSISALLDEALQPQVPSPPAAGAPPLSAGVEKEAKSEEIGGRTTGVPDDAEAHDPSPPQPAVTTGQATGAAAWRPLLQVDRVVWPSISGRLQTNAGEAVDRMAEGLLSVCRPGRNVLGLASCASGEGVTTLLLAAARSLLRQGRTVALIDGNWRNPQLAQCLGLLPQIGWEEVLCGGLPLEEVVIESLADGLAVLPVRQPSACEASPGQIAATFELLRHRFDVVLVDLGAIEQAEPGESAPHDVAARTDAVVIVQNVRVTPPNRLAEVREHLAASNLPFAGTIQNFVAG